jgi:hypothetical protein
MSKKADILKKRITRISSGQTAGKARLMPHWDGTAEGPWLYLFIYLFTYVFIWWWRDLNSGPCLG